MATPVRFELTTSDLEGRRSIQMSYGVSRITLAQVVVLVFLERLSAREVQTSGRATEHIALRRERFGSSRDRRTSSRASRKDESWQHRALPWLNEGQRHGHNEQCEAVDQLRLRMLDAKNPRTSHSDRHNHGDLCRPRAEVL